MPKSQYQFNPESVSFEKKKNSFRKKFFLILGFLLTSLLLGFFAFWLYAQFFNSPKEKQLIHENEILRANYELMDKKLNTLSGALQDMQNRDDNLYRFLLKADPLPSELRNSTLGSVNKYKDLEKMSNMEVAENTAKNLDKMLKKAYVQSKSLDEIEQLANDQKEMLESLPAIIPVRKELLRSYPSGYGMRLHPILGIKRMHKGMDFSVPSGSDIYATGAGVVEKVVKKRSGYGIHVVIKHNYGGYQTLYAHMLRTKVRRGQKVKRGDVIGYVGNTGLSSAPHVHYEVRKDGRALNPINFYSMDLTPEEYERIIHETNSSVQSFD